MKQKVSFTIPEEILKAVKELAKNEKRNMSNMTSVLIERGLEKTKAA